ncbi:MAG: PDZ domain-containing protein, partial [Verrucomicrobiae bacterium]|nr:PDZ domain-containing protein [Verrucomicrobiae bacterium]NNJ87741.1 PDZ domain-containing protein [Akkermansiaceae bacterium]
MIRRILAFCTLIATLSISASAARIKNIPNPDFTKGEPIPKGATHDWTLGATGARGWIYSHRLETRNARQIRITRVASGSPADGVLKVGDVILGIGDRPFATDARVAFGKALTAAESTEGDGQLKLLHWRGGQTQTVTLKLPVLGDYSTTTPYS